MDPSEDQQQLEITALKSIYDQDFIECPPPKVWKGAPRLPEFIIRVRHPDPEYSLKIYFSLHVKFPKTYPTLATPIFTIQPPTEGIKPNELSKLSSVISTEAQSLKGAETVFQVVVAAQDWIARNVVYRIEPAGSLATQMTQRALEEEQARKQREENEAERAHEREREREQELEEQIRADAERQQIERERVYQARKRAMSDVTEVPSLTYSEESESTPTESFPEIVEWQDVRFKKVHLFQPQTECLGTVYQAQPVSEDERASHLKLELLSVVFDSRYYSTTQGRKKLKMLEGEIQRLSHVRHTNLLAVLAIKLILSNSSNPPKLLILHERRPSVTLHDVLEDSDWLRESRATEYFTQILSALNALHTAELIHRGLDIRCVGLVTGSQGEPKRVKVFKVGYYVQLLNMNRSEPFASNAQDDSLYIPEAWLPKDAQESPLVYTRNRDIHAAGIVLLQMLMGRDVMISYPDVNEALKNSSITPRMQQHILNMLSSGKKTISANSMLVSMAGVVLADAMKTPAIVINGNTPRTPVPSFVNGSPPNDYTMFRPPARHVSRWKEDWEELELLGRGGFGSVVKARNKIDSRIYAVKKIKLRSGQSDQKIFREVNTLSRVNHRFIVRYYTTWIEYSDSSATTSTVGSSASTSADDSTGTSVPGGRSMANSFDENDPLAINWSEVRSPTNGHSFPNVQFTNSVSSDSEDESDPTDGDTTGGSSEDSSSDAGILMPKKSPVHGNSTPVLNISKTLFIQMEFVERQTLKERIAEGISEEESWRLFQQIVDALAHMYSLNILHRDIKLTNIFIDGKGDCKIGDFGLATFNLDVVDPSDIAPQIHWMDGDFTLDVGTRLYIAPEVQSSKGKSRGQGNEPKADKADMYSLGIVFFEMNYMFTTGAERIVVLENLRKPQIFFPAAWETHRTRQKQIITWLLQHDPAKRPTPVELSESPLMPPRVEDEQFKNTLGTIVKSDSPYRQSILSALFKQCPDQAHGFLYDSVELPEHTTLNGIVHDRMVQIFRLHGAVDMEPPLLLPMLSSEEDGSRAVFLDRNGKVVSLPNNVFAPFARLAARITLRRIKRYHICDIYKPDPVAGHPLASKAAVFDIISQDLATGPSAATAEAISIMNDCLDSFANLDKYDIHLSHTTIYDAVFQQIPSQIHADILKILVQSNASLSQKRQLLSEKGLARHVLEELDVLLEGDIDVDVLTGKLERISPQFVAMIGDAIREVKLTMQFAVASGVQRSIYFKPLFMMRNPNSLFRGLCFEVVKRQPPNQKRADILAIGGRYEHLIHNYSPVKSKAEGICAVAMQVSLEKITVALASFQSTALKTVLKERRSYGYWSPRRCDVYVAAHPSDSEATLTERLEVTALLWRNNISADMMYEFGSAEHENIVEQCLREGILFIVYPRARTVRRDQPAFKVKAVLKSGEDLLSRQELVPFLVQQIADQKRIDASISGAPLVAESSQGQGSAKEPGTSEVQLLLPADAKKQRKQTKQIFLDRAFEFGVELKNVVTHSGMPIIAIDVPTSVFEELTRNTGWINDENAWKPVFASFPTQQSAYAYQVRDAVRKRRGEGCKFLLLFAVREERAFLLTL